MNMSNLKPGIQLHQRLMMAIPYVMIILIVPTAAGIVALGTGPGGGRTER